MNIYLHELRSYLKNTLIWTISLCVATVMLFSMFPAFHSNADVVVKLFEGFPEEVRNALGFPIDMVATVTGYYSFILTYIVLCGAIQAMSLGLSALGKESAGKTADFLLTKPVTRTQVVTAKLLAVLTCAAVTSAVYIAVSVMTALAFNTGEMNFSPFVLMSLTLFYVQLIFIAMGFLVAVVVPKIKSVLPVSLSVVIGFFIVGMVAAALEEKKLYYLTPFKYFEPVYIIQNATYELPYVILGALFVVTAVLLSYVIYTKKDIHAA